jgi:hypothetical protein
MELSAACFDGYCDCAQYGPCQLAMLTLYPAAVERPQ